MKKTSVILIIAIIASLCTQQVVSSSVSDREGMVLLMLNVCGVSHDTFSSDTETPCINERVSEFVPHASLSRHLIPAFMRFDSLPASERDRPPRFSA